jgi:8-oxo-dGTP pyrophosphatase MutT (NUDIX family)
MADRLLGGLAEADRANHHHVHVTFVQKAFVVREGRLLLVRKSASDPHHPGLWEAPGGRLQQSDALDEHLVREVREESGIEIQPGPPFHLWEWEMREAGGRTVRAIAVGRICEPLTHELSTDHQVPGDHISEVDWVPLAEIPEYSLIPGMDMAVDHFLLLQMHRLTDSLLRITP